ncbi:hypothetical protein BC835DRAFT_1274738, partial [Cytidiella melzeri]
RYEAVIVGGVHNPHRPAVLRDIVNAILECPAEDGRPARWRPQEEQAVMLKAMYQKWLAHGGVWSEAAAKAHTVQMGHVIKGCLSCPRSDVRSDGSRIEGSHKGWNPLQRANPSGYQAILFLAGDHVQRRNISVISNSKEFSPSLFIASSHGCHHLALVNFIAHRWNTFLNDHNPSTTPRGTLTLTNHATLHLLPTLANVLSQETFGAVVSTHAMTFGGLVKIEDDDDDDNLLDISLYDEERRQEILQEMNIDPQLANTFKKRILVPIDPVLLECSPSTAPNSSTPAMTAPPVSVSCVRTAPSTVEALSERLPLPDDMLGLTPSARLFKIHTNIDPTSLKISGDVEYFLFMDLRAKHHWASHRMTSTSYVEATHNYNEALVAAYQNKSSHPPSKKNPRAIMDKLGEIEGEVLERLARNDFKCESSLELIV